MNWTQQFFAEAGIDLTKDQSNIGERKKALMMYMLKIIS